MSEYADIVNKYKDMSIEDLGTSLLQRQADVRAKQAKRDRKDRRVQQGLAVLLAGQSLFKNAFKRRQNELQQLQTIDLLNVDSEAKQIQNISSILNFKPEEANSLIDFTKQINPATGNAYTVDENVNRFFSNSINNEGFVEKLSPLLDQKLQFSGNKNLEVDDPARYRLLQEVMAKQAFANLIDGDNHVKFVDAVNNDIYSGQYDDPSEILSQSLGITPEKLQAYKRKRYAELEREYKSKGMFRSMLNLFKSIGQEDADKTGRTNLFAGLTEEMLNRDIELDNVLPLMSLEALVGKSFDEAIRKSRLSPVRYLNEANTAKYENLRQSMLTEIVPELQREVQRDMAFSKYGLQNYIPENIMDSVAKDLRDTNSVAGVNFAKRATALSLRLKNDPQYAVELLAGQPLDKKKEFIAAMQDDKFRHKVAAFLVLKAGTSRAGVFRGYEFFGAETPLAQITTQFEDEDSFKKDIKTKYGYNSKQASEILDPSLTVMFERDGSPTKEYTKLPSNRKVDTHYQFIKDMKPNTPEGRAMAEKFNTETPNPLNLPFDEYLQTMKEQEDLDIEIKLIEDTRYLSGKQVEQYRLNSARIQNLKEDIRNEMVTSVDLVTGRTVTEEASPTDIDNMKGQIRRLESANDELLEKPRGMDTFFTIGLQEQRVQLQNDIALRKSLLPRQREIMGDSEYEARVNTIAEKEQQLKLIESQIEDFGLEEAEDLKYKAKVEAKIKTDERRNPFVAKVKGEIRSREGLRLEAYKPDPTEEYFTIGHGHYGADVKEGMTISKTRAEELLHEDVMERVDSIENLIPTFQEMPEELQVAIFSEHFRGSIAQSKNTLKLINEGKYAEAADEFLDNAEYKNARKLGIGGIRPRMEAVANALRDFDRIVYPEKYEDEPGFFEKILTTDQSIENRRTRQQRRKEASLLSGD
jgi:GH24 family phage-related lysozyme (muramidase)